MKLNRWLKTAAVFCALWGLFHVASGVYHTTLFATAGSQSLYSMAYGIPVTASDMQDPARLLGSDAIEVYSVLLFGYGVLALLAAVLILRVQHLGFWLMTVMGAIAQWAVLYGLVFQGRLSGANAYTDLVLYGCTSDSVVLESGAGAPLRR